MEAVQHLFPGSVHVTKVGLSHGTSDRQIWDYAARHGFAIITADKDFLEMAEAMGPPPQNNPIGEL